MNMTNENSNFKHGIYVLSYLLLVGVESYFIKSMSVLYSPHIFLGVLVALGLGLNFVFLFLFRKSENIISHFLIYQFIQGALAFLISYFLFHLNWMDSLAYPSGAIIALISFILIKADLALRNVLLTVFLAVGVTLSLRFSGVSGGLLFALALMNGYYLGSTLTASHSIQKGLWEDAVIFTCVLALGRAAIQYYLILSNYDSLGVVITLPYSFVGLFAGIFIPAVYYLIAREKVMNLVLACIVLGILFPWVLGVFIHVRPFAAYLLGFVVSSFTVGVLFSAPLSLSVVSYLNLASGVLGLTVFSLLSNLSRGVRLGILAGVFVLSLLGYLLQSLLQKNKSSAS